jgi:hypothetical protein
VLDKLFVLLFTSAVQKKINFHCLEVANASQVIAHHLMALKRRGNACLAVIGSR